MTTPTDSPTEKLLQQLVDARDEDRQALGALTDSVRELKPLLGIVRSSQTRGEETLLEIRSELQRQDQQIQNLERRISGNYMGVSAQYDVLSQELSGIKEFLTNIERAVVEISRDWKTLHGRFIEEKKRTGALVEEFRGELDEVRKRLPVSAELAGGRG